MMRLWFIGLVFMLPLFAVAQSSEFEITLFTGIDTAPPTTPVIQTVEPVSSNQIDIAWSASTDNIMVNGYRVFRDGVQVATTTQTSFNDTGLTASTTYEYTIDAFDYVFNFSSTSLPVATTTLPVFVPPPTPTSTPATANTATAVVSIDTLTIKAAVRSASVELLTTIPTTYTLRFGRTSQYELGTVSNSVFRTEHISELINLEPGTKYYVEVTVYGARGQESVQKVTFVTEAAITTDTPLSVTGAKVEVIEDTAIIRWENPDPLEGVVRVVRNYLFYPQNQSDGVVVYEGTGESFTDNAVLQERDKYYYTIFVLAPDGRVSAGVVLRASKETLIPDIGTTTPTTTPTINEPLEEGGSILNPSDIFFTFNGQTVSFSTVSELPVRTPILLSIPKEALPPNLKSVLVSVQNPVNNNETTVYLLKLRADEKAYEARFVTSDVEGEGRIMVELYDYEQAMVHRITKLVRYESDRGLFVGPIVESSLRPLLYVFTLLPLLLLLFIFYHMQRRA